MRLRPLWLVPALVLTWPWYFGLHFANRNVDGQYITRDAFFVDPSIERPLLEMAVPSIETLGPHLLVGAVFTLPWTLVVTSRTRALRQWLVSASLVWSVMTLFTVYVVNEYWQLQLHTLADRPILTCADLAEMSRAHAHPEIDRGLRACGRSALPIPWGAASQ